MAVTDDGNMEVSAGAQAAIRSAMTTLQRYGSEPRVAALIRRLNAIESPEGGFGDGDEQLAKSMIDCDRIAKSEDVSDGLRDRARDASFELQRAHLRKHSGGATVWESAAKEAGRVA
jgi:hypothetical protein